MAAGFDPGAIGAEPVAIAASDALLGEGPVWSAAEHALYWVDIKRPALHRLSLATGELSERKLPEPVGAVALRRGGGMVAAARSGFAELDPASGALRLRLCPDRHPPGNRMNDGKCDRSGRFWAASMDDQEHAASGCLYRLDADFSCALVGSGFVVGNGLGWSPDDRVFYFTDSAARRIWAHDFDAASGNFARRRLFAEIPAEAGFPDGLAVDAEGFVWSAHWDGWRLTRYAPDGRIDRVVPVPVPRPTSCAFAGPDLDILFITSARIGLADEQRAAAPLSGSLFALRPGVRGLPVGAFAG